MDPARMFKESLTSRPELENSQGHLRRFGDVPTTSALPLETDNVTVRRHLTNGPTGDVYPAGPRDCDDCSGRWRRRALTGSSHLFFLLSEHETIALLID